MGQVDKKKSGIQKKKISQGFKVGSKKAKKLRAAKLTPLAKAKVAQAMEVDS